jgi:hypothetical protein
VYRAEILTIFGSYFGRNEDFINSFRYLLTNILKVIRMLTSSKSLLILGSCLLGLALAQDEENSGYKLIQAKPKNDRDRELLKEMDEFYPEDVVDFWSDPKEDTVEFLVQGRSFVLFVLMEGRCCKYNITTPDE